MSEPLPDREELVAVLARAAGPDAPPAHVEHARRLVDARFAAEQDGVYRFCLRLVGEPQLARELAQETFLTAYRRLGTYNGSGSFRSWLLGIARFKCLRALEKHTDALTTDGILEAADPERGVYNDLRRSEQEEVLAAASAAVLDPTEQEAVYLRYTQNLGQEQITQVLGLTTKSGARGLLQRCRNKLRKELRRRLEEIGHSSSFFHDSQP